MFVVLLRFSTGKGSAPALVPGHDAWIARGVDDGVFLVVGSLRPGLGGAVLAHGIGRADLEARLADDPFVASDVVKAEIFEVTPARTSPRLAFLLEDVPRPKVR